MIPVMLVEDEFLVRVGLKTCIPWEELGYQIVAEADSAETALQKYQENAPQLIITDIRLPHKSGIELMHILRSRDKSVRFIIISAYDDFSIAQQAIEVGVDGYFVKGNLDTDKLSRLLSELRTERFGDQGKLSAKPAKAKETMQKIYKNWPTLRKDQRLATLREGNQSLYLVLFQAPGTQIGEFTEMVSSYLNSQNIPHYFLEETARAWTFLAVDQQHLTIAMNKVLLMSARYLNNGIRIGVSSDYFLREDLENTIFEALLAANHPSDTGTVLEYYAERAAWPTKGTLKQFEELLRLGCFQDAAAMLDTMFQSLLERYSVKNFLGTMYGLIGILTVCGANPAEFRNILEKLELGSIFSQLKEQTLRLEEKGEVLAQDNAYVKKAKDYILCHLKQRLKVNTIAQAVHVSPNYLGRIFLNETGEYLTDYINRSKIEYAKEVLSERQHNVMEVAALVGIPDQRYFSKLFKKYCGVTPSEYANQATVHPM